MRLSIVAAATLLASVAQASSLQPPVLPLIVRNPYLSTWLQNAREEPWSKWPMFWTGAEVGFGVLASLPHTKEIFPLLGRPHDSLEPDTDDYILRYPTYKGAKYDASTTNLTFALQASDTLTSRNDIEITLSFLSPITPTSTLRQAIPASYLSVHVQGSFDVNLYVDVNGQWVSGQRESLIEWNLNEQATAEGLKTWSVKRQVQQIFTETDDQPEWGQLHFTGPADTRHESGTSALLRQRFARTGTLQNEVDGNFRGVMDDEPVFAFAKEFRLANASSNSAASSVDSSVLFTIAHIQDPVTQYAAARGLTFMRPLWESWFPKHEKLIQFHYGDFSTALGLAGNYSEQLRIDAYQSGATDYVDIVALSARQVMGATSFSGTPENPLLFLKEISSNGNCQTVDVIFPAFPFFLYTQPRWLAYLLEPLLEHQLSGQYPNKYSMHDLGAHFPNLTGHADGRDEYMPVEECGDMLIMGLALVNSLTYGSAAEAQSIWSSVGSDVSTMNSVAAARPFSLTHIGSHNDIEHIDGIWGGSAKGIEQAKAWLEGSYDLWKQWTGYLVEDSLEPHNQHLKTLTNITMVCTDDFAGWLPNQVNLALKGIIGIKAFSELALLLDRPGDAKYYRNISEVYIKKWEELGISRDGSHAKLAYDWYGSWTTLYSLFADAVLCFHPTITNQSSLPRMPDFSSVMGEAQQALSSHGGRPPITHDFIPHAIYKKQSSWYSAVMQKFGLPLDSRHLYTKSDWEFEAAAVASESTRKEILDRVARWINETSTDRAFTDLYETEWDGGFPRPHFFARPVVGGHFAFLALEHACGRRGKTFDDADAGERFEL
ncbi:glutaminase A [Plenodomus tracheiphilus IPT5]|uniref:Glutaminase A n=1 Tax=Plenodomus tracheiphilus IPT5 TaxID=1408161 RepID=A0A6A7B437_9PLEO|nr:glutaminase A [Plenodomus tracheiphilus IPT5]